MYNGQTSQNADQNELRTAIEVLEHFCSTYSSRLNKVDSGFPAMHRSENAAEWDVYAVRIYRLFQNRPREERHEPLFGALLWHARLRGSRYSRLQEYVRADWTPAQPKFPLDVQRLPDLYRVWVAFAERSGYDQGQTI